MPWIGVLLSSLLGSAVSRMLVGAGLGLVTFAVLTPLIMSALNAAANGLGGLTADLLSIAEMAGIGIAVSAIGSAMVARASIDAARVAVTKVAS